MASHHALQAGVASHARRGGGSDGGASSGGRSPGAQQFQELARTVREAFACIAGAMTPQDKRAQATQFIEDLKNNNPDGCFRICAVLANAKEPDIIRFNAMTTIGTLIVQNWKSFDPAMKKELQNQSLSLISDGTKPLLQEVRFVKEKAIQILVTIATRQWPQEWPDLTDVLFGMSQQSPKGLEMTLRVFKHLSEQVLEFNISIPNQRREDVKTGLGRVCKELFVLQEQVLTQYFQMFQQDRRNRTCIAILRACLDCLSMYTSWGPSVILFKGDLIPLVCSMVPVVEEGFFKMAMSCLSGIAGRDIENPERQEEEMVETKDKMGLIWNTSVNALEWAIKSKALEENEEDVFEVIQTISHLCKKHFHVLDAANSEAEKQQKFNVKIKLLTCLVECLKRPSFRLSDAILNVWDVLYGRPGTLLPAKEHEQKLVNKLLQVCHTKLIKDVFSGDTYTDEKDYNDQFNSIRHKTLLFLKTLLAAHAELCWGKLVQSFQSFYKVEATDHLNCAGLSSTDSTAYRNWEGFSRLTKAYTDDCTKTKLFEPPCNETVLKSAEEILLLLLNFTTKDPLICAVQMNILIQFDAIFKAKQQALKMCLDKILSVVKTFIPCDISDDPKIEEVRKQIINVRRRCFFGLIKLSKKIPASLLPLFSGLFTEIQTLMDRHPVWPDEKALLYEFLISVSSQITELEKRCEFLKMMAAQHLESWCSQKVAELFDQPENFFRMITLPKDEKSAGELTQHRKNIRDTLETLIGIFRGARNKNKNEQFSVQVKDRSGQNNSGAANGTSMHHNSPNGAIRSPMEKKEDTMGVFVWSLVQPTLANAYRALRLINSLRAPSATAGLPSEFEILQFSHISMVDHKLASFADYATTDADRRKKHVREVWVWLDNIRSNCYKLIANAAHARDNFFTQKQSQYLLDSVFLNFHCFDLLGLKDVITKVFVPLCAYCPSSMYTPFLLPITKPIFQVTFQNLSSAWARHKQMGSQTSSDDLKWDVLLQDNMRLLTRSVLLALHALCIPRVMHWRRSAKKYKNRRKSGSFSTKPLHKHDIPLTHGPELFCQWLFRYKDMYEMLAKGLFSCLTWDDCKSIAYCSELLSQYCKILQEQKQFYPMLAEALKIAIMTLANYEADDQQAFQIPTTQLIRDVYYKLSQHNCEVPRNTFLSIPGVDPADVDNLDNILFKQHASDKKDRVAVKTFLQKYVIGKGKGFSVTKVDNIHGAVKPDHHITSHNRAGSGPR